MISGTVGVVPDFEGRVAALLDEKGASWSWLAKRADLSRQGVRYLVRAPSIPETTFLALCSALGVEPSTLIEMRDPL